MKPSKKFVLLVVPVALQSLWPVVVGAQTKVLGWAPPEQAALEQLAVTMTNAFGAIPDTIERTPRQILISFTNAPFTPIWFTPTHDGGIMCHDLGPMIERSVAKPIAAYVYNRSPDQAVDTVTVVFHKSTGRLETGGCRSDAHLRFRPEELLSQRGLIPAR